MIMTAFQRLNLGEQMLIAFVMQKSKFEHFQTEVKTSDTEGEVAQECAQQIPLAKETMNSHFCNRYKVLDGRIVCRIPMRIIRTEEIHSYRFQI